LRICFKLKVGNVGCKSHALWIVVDYLQGNADLTKIKNSLFTISTIKRILFSTGIT
jgi:hypothetical protein